MHTIVTLSGIDEALHNLGYANEKHIKTRVIRALRKLYSDENSIRTITEISPDDLIRLVWDTDNSKEAVKNKRKNFSSIKSSINSDLTRLHGEGKNPEGVIIGRNNTFDMSDKAKTDLLETFSNAGQGDSLIPLGKINDVLEVVNDILKRKRSGLETDGADDKKNLDQLKELIQSISQKIGISGDHELNLNSGYGLSDASGKIAGTETDPGKQTGFGGGLDKSGLDGPLKGTDEELEGLDAEEIPEEDLEAVNDVEEAQDSKDLEDEIEVVEESEDIDEVEDETEEVEDLGEGDAELGLEDIEEDEALEEIEDLEDVEDTDEIEELEETEDLEDAADELEEVEELEEAEDAEEIEEVPAEQIEDDLEEIDSDDELEDLAAEEITDDGLEEVEDVEDIDEIEELEETDDLEDADEVLEEVEDLEDAEEIEEVPAEQIEDALEELDDAAQASAGDDLAALEFLNGYRQEGHSGENGISKARLLAEEFNNMLSSMDRYFNQYILIPGGNYPIGTKNTGRDDKNAGKVEVSEFYFGKFPVTNALFEIFIEKTGYITTAERLGYGTVYYGRYQNTLDPKTGLKTVNWNSALESRIIEGACWYQPAGPGSTLYNKRNHPVVQVSLEDALAFASWTGKGLPTEPQWEAASMTLKGYRYPWGKEYKKGLCNIEDSYIGDTTPVDKHPEGENSFGIMDTLGNIMEWTIDKYKPLAEGNQGVNCIVKGGCWISGSDLCLCSRHLSGPDVTSNIQGFRCVAY